MPLKMSATYSHDLILMYGWPEGGVSHANRYCTPWGCPLLCLWNSLSDFVCLDTKIRYGVDMKPNLSMKCRYFCFYENY
jgi:hypothetical protein